jgi:hypothetical protein
VFVRQPDFEDDADVSSVLYRGYFLADEKAHFNFLSILWTN